MQMVDDHEESKEVSRGDCGLTFGIGEKKSNGVDKLIIFFCF